MQWIVLTICLVTYPSEVASDISLGIPGTTNTINGYDTELGTDPICWRSQSYDEIDNQGEQKTAFPNDLIDDFSLAGEVELMEACPRNSVNLTVHLPDIFATNQFVPGFRPRTKNSYKFRVTGSVDAAAMGARHFVSDRGSQLVVQVVLCRLDATGFCSPFVHEQSNARNAAHNITTKLSKGDLHGGTHVHSSKTFVPLPDCEGLHAFSVDVPFLVNDPGDFFAIAAVQFFVGNSSEFVMENTPLTRYDVANAAAERVVKFEEPAEVSDVAQGVEIAVYIFMGISCLAILFLLGETFRHRKNQIMKLSQGNFLIALLVAALIATACVPLMNPTISDFVCTIYPPLIAIPLQLIYAIIIGRVWRTQQVLSPLLQEFYVTPISVAFNRMIGFLACAKQTNSLKATVTNRQLSTVVFILTLPQVILQVLALSFQRSRIEIVFTEDATIGRQECRTDAPKFLSLVDFGFYFILIMNALLMVVAQASKRLPSLFNELRMISDMSFTNFVVLLIGVTILIVTNTPTSPPDVSFIIWAMMILSVTLNSSIRLLYPKLRMVWNGETVLVSKLVTNHRKEMSSKKSSVVSGESGSFREKMLKGVTGFSFGNHNGNAQQNIKATENSLVFSSNYTSGNEISETEKDIESPPLGHDSNGSLLEDSDVGLLGHKSNGSLLDDSLDVLRYEEDQPFPRRSSNGLPPMYAIKEDTVHQERPIMPPLTPSKRSKSLKVLVSDNVTPSRTLVVPMVKLQEKLIEINTRVTTGLGVSHEEWEDVRSMTAKLGDKFANHVTFDWESGEQRMEE